MRVEKILLVDDDNITNELNKYLIHKSGIGEDIKVLKNGKEALDYLEEACRKPGDSPLLMFLDINMPVMNGREFLDMFQKNGKCAAPAPVILVLSTSDIKTETEHFDQHPAVLGRIEKPLTTEKLQRAILAYTEHSVNATN